MKGDQKKLFLENDEQETDEVVERRQKEEGRVLIGQELKREGKKTFKTAQTNIDGLV